MKKAAKKFVNFLTPYTSRETRSSSSSHQKGRVAYEEFSFDLPHHAKVNPAMWPCDTLMMQASILEDFDSYL